MTKFVTLASGSSGNSSFIEHKGVKVLVDAGFSGKKIQDLLEKVGEKASDLDAIFLTHEHNDHSQGAGVLSKRFDIPIFANAGTWQGFAKKAKRLKDDNIKVFKTDEFVNFKSMDILPISIHHDAREPVGYVFYLGNKKITLLSDTGLVDERIAYEIKGSDIYYMEANHDLEALKMGPYPHNLKLRVMGKMGHLSNDQSAEALADALVGKQEHVFLSHLSDTNNTPELSRLTVDNYLTLMGLDTKKDIKLEVCERYTPSKIVEL